MTKAKPIDDTKVFISDQLDQLALQLAVHRCILVWGDMGVGKSTLAMALSQFLSRRPGYCQILELDPGRPPFGIPGAVSRGWWTGTGFEWGDSQALCSLDAARFRLPLILAARRLGALIERSGHIGPLIIDPPGVVRGVGGAELLTALAESFKIDAIVTCFRQGAPLRLDQELSSFPAALFGIQASPAAKRPSKRESAEQRTRLWDKYLSDTVEVTLSLEHIPVLGTPPPGRVPEAWSGRQAALLDVKGSTIRMGEVIGLSEGALKLRMPHGPEVDLAAILIRDAGRNAEGRLETVGRVGKPAAAQFVPAEMTPPVKATDTGEAPLFTRVGAAWAALVGGVFGDPLLHVRLRNLKQSYLFDLGDPGRLPAKVAHQVRAVFLSHAHIDHIGGFLWFLRSRIGRFGPCKIFGPSTTITRIRNHILAVTWDRIEENAPIFEVFEIFGNTLKGARLRPGKKTIALPEKTIKDGVILKEDSFSIRAIVCDHGVSSVAYALELHPEIRVSKPNLAAFGWFPGPWLGKLKQCLAAGKPEEEIKLPDQTVRRAGELAEELIAIRSGLKLVYAADMADTPENRKKLTSLAHSAHTLFCETAFTKADKKRADANQHLTTLAAVEIARQAGVKQLVPFHFSKRYEHDPGLVYNEILAAAGPVKIIGRYK